MSRRKTPQRSHAIALERPHGAVSTLNAYIDRAGKGLSLARSRVVEGAKGALGSLFGKRKKAHSPARPRAAKKR